MATPAGASLRPVISTRMPRLGSPVRISFAPDTNFDEKHVTRNKDTAADATYNIKPIQRHKNVMKFKAPASTAPSLPWLTTSQNDYRDPGEQRDRFYHPGPQWFYRSQSDLLVDAKEDEDLLGQGRKVLPPQFINKLNKKGRAVSDTVTYAMRGYDYSTHQRVSNKRAASAQFKPNQPAGTRLLSGKSNDSFREFFSQNSVNFKPLVGNSDDRFIENARLLRIVPTNQHNPLVQIPPSPMVTTSKVYTNAPYRKSKFTDSLRVPTKHDPLFLDRGSIQRPYNPTRSLDDSYRQQQRMVRNNGSETSCFPVVRQRTSLQDLDRSMQRTFQKQEILKDLVAKKH